MSRRRPSAAPLLRRGVQLLCLGLFFILVLATRSSTENEVPHEVELFVLVDPLIFVTTWLASHALYAGALLALVTIAVTLVLGRVFCGWVCPLGTIHDVAGWATDRLQHGPKRASHWSRWQLAKYYLLAGFLAMALLGGHWVCAFDPIVLLYRTTTTVLFPAVQWGVETPSKAVFDADPTVGGYHVSEVTDLPYNFLRDHVFVLPNQAFLGSGLIAALFVAIVLLNVYRRRFWCRYLCPLGALLGCLSWRPLLRRHVKEGVCNQCDLCSMSCHGAAAASPGQDWKPAECLGCLNCTDSCRRDGLGFAWVRPWRRRPSGEKLDLSRRAVLGAAVGGVAAMSLLRITPQARGTAYHPQLIRPPGSRPEREFLARCTACGMCMKICPTGGLQPALTEAGLEGLWTPRLVPRIGHCDYMCNVCGQVCPTEAIRPLSVEAKHEVKIGLAAFDTTRCIPYAYGRDCMICEEVCPIPDKAIYFLEIEVRLRDGATKTIKQPRVDADRCTGCGQCENVCVLKDRPGIRVFSTNEGRRPGDPSVQPAPSEDSPY
jgi:MauM/NapG family ferredoxin protein